MSQYLMYPTISEIEMKRNVVVSKSLRRIATSLVNSVVREANSVVEAARKDNDDEKNKSVFRFATEFVDGILEESFKQLEIKSVPDKVESISPLRHLFPKTFVVQQDKPFVYEMAKDFIDNILDESKRRTMNFKLQGIKRFQNYKTPHDFKVRDGMELVARCINQWSINPNWHLEIKYNGRLIKEESHSYFYALKLSVPTQSYPIAQVTVDVYFTVEVMPMTSPPVFIDLWYRLETDRSQRRAFTTDFKEKWLQTILTRKLQAIQSFQF